MKLHNQLAEKHILFIGGKGGVGKTTISASLAVKFAQAGRKTLIISTDPAHNLGDVLGISLGHKTKRIMPSLDALELDTHRIVHDHYRQIERTLSAYTRPEMLPKMQSFLRITQHAPSAEEAAMLEAICTHLLTARDLGYRHIIFDTAPTGHTLRLLTLPELMQTWTEGLLAQQKYQAQLKNATKALSQHSQYNPFVPTGNDRWADAVTALEKRRTLFANARTLLQDTTQTAITLVLIPENLPLIETERTVKLLAANNLPCAGIFVNQVMAQTQHDSFWNARAERQQQIITTIQHTLGHLTQQYITLQQQDICGISALSSLLDN